MKNSEVVCFAKTCNAIVLVEDRAKGLSKGWFVRRFRLSGIDQPFPIARYVVIRLQDGRELIVIKHRDVRPAPPTVLNLH